MNASLRRKFYLFFFLFIFSFLLSIAKGSVNIRFQDLLLNENRQILILRLFRSGAAVVAGMGLATSGIAFQSVLRNPLAEPYLLGTSSGAGLGAVLAIIIGLDKIYLPFAAFIGAILTVILVYNLARQNGRLPVQSLILSGVIISLALSGIIVLLVSFSGNETLHGLMWWLWGSLQVYDIKLFSLVSILTLLGSLAIFILSQDLNAISIGEEEAMHLGINTETVKKILFIITSLITAGVVCVCGVIGFVGLIVPHSVRFIFGPNHKVLIPATCIAAAIFMLICDTLSRTLFVPLEIPIGVITAIIGAPIFIILLKSKQRIK